MEATFYTEGFTRFNQNDFENAGFDKELIANGKVFALLQDLSRSDLLFAVACDETGHVNFLET